MPDYLMKQELTPFLNRIEELDMLTSRIASARAELLVVYGRRRVGKTELLTHLAAGTRSLYLEATDTMAAEQLRDLSEELARSWNNELLRTQPLTTWEAALTAITQFVGDQPTLIVLDEFQLLARQSPELQTTLSRWWRTTGRHMPLTLILAGSELSFFEDEVLAGQLYGRRTGQMKIEPFVARDAALFHPGYSPDDRVRAYSICGGIPYYLDRFRDARPLADNMLAEVFERTGLLHDEAELMLRQSIADPANHSAVLRSIAHGYNRNNDIVQRTGLNPANVTKVLGALERLALVQRLQPITASPRTKKTAYAISDHFLRFHYRFVDHARSQLRTRDYARRYLDKTVLPQLDHFTSGAWEDVSREHVQRTMREATAVGRWWGQVPTGVDRRTEEREIDVVATDASGTPVAVGMCKWTAGKVDFNELNLLDRLASSIPGHAGSEQRFLFSRSGFTERLKALAADDPSLRLVMPADIY